MKLIDVYDDERAGDILWRLLSERTPEQSISHRAMPSPAQHRAFIASRPYLAWYLVEDQGQIRGACYLSQQREIGVFIFKGMRGYGRRAVRLLMETHPGRFLANVNPENIASARLFESVGFRHVQDTYEYAA